MSGVQTLAKPHRIKAAHRRRGKAASGQSVQRYYDPGIGRFLSVDPVTADGNTGGSFNRYKYASNNPYRFTDPDGRQSQSAMDRRFVYPHLDSGQQADIEAQHNEIGKQAFNGMVEGAGLFFGGVTLRGLKFLTPAEKFLMALFLGAFKEPTLDGDVKVPGRGRIVNHIEAALSIAKKSEKVKIVTKGAGALAAPGGISAGQRLEGGARVNSVNKEAGTANVSMPAETGSRIRKTVEVCADKQKCG